MSHWQEAYFRSLAADSLRLSPQSGNVFRLRREVPVRPSFWWHVADPFMRSWKPSQSNMYFKYESSLN